MPTPSGHAKSSSASGTSHSFSHTVDTGNWRVLYLYISTINNPSSISATYNGVAMTQIASSSVGTSVKTYLFRLINPAMGANTVALSWTGAAYVNCVSASFSNVDQTTPNGTAVTGSGQGAGSTPSISVPSDVSSLVVDFTAVNVLGLVIPYVGAGQTELESGVSDANLPGFGSSYESGAASVTMSWSLSYNPASTDWCSIGVSLNPVASNFFIMF